MGVAVLLSSGTGAAVEVRVRRSSEAETRDLQPGRASGVRVPTPFGETPPGEADRNLRLCLAGGGAGEEEEDAGEVGVAHRLM